MSDILFHGTTSRLIRKITEEGILPRNVTRIKSNFSAAKNCAYFQGNGPPSAMDRVYLTDAYAPYFSTIASQKGETPIMFAINRGDIPASHLLMADEDCIEQVDAAINRYKHSREEMIRRTAKFKRKAPELAIKKEFTADKSLALLGTCAVQNGVPPEALLGYVEFEPNKTWQVFDPTIMLMNYKLLGPYYRYASKLIWNDGNPPDRPEKPEQLWAGLFGRTWKECDDRIMSIVRSVNHFNKNAVAA